MKKILAFCLAAAMVLGGCGNGSENTTEETGRAAVPATVFLIKSLLVVIVFIFPQS